MTARCVFVLMGLSVLAPGSLCSETLRQAANKTGLYVGAAINYGHLSEKEYVDVHAAQYSMATPENCCKWGTTHPGQGTYNMDPCFKTFKQCQGAGQLFRGHNLCWGADNPGWLTNGKFSPDELRSILKDHIIHVAGYEGLDVYAWDVVNEAVGNNGGLKTSNPWYPAVPDYLDVAFNATRAVKPTAKLFYNDYGAETENAKSNYIYSMVQDMRKRGIPVDGVGFQFHWDINHVPDMDSVSKNLARFAALGLEVHITELDISCGGNCDYNKQAQVYAEVTKVAMRYAKGLVTWGFTDKYTWRGTDNHPLPFDTNYNPKPAFWAMLSTLLGNETVAV